MSTDVKIPQAETQAHAANGKDVKLPIYMDNHATTPMDPRVLEEMLPYFMEKFGNSASRNHSFGWAAEEGVETARERIAKLIGATTKEVIFTSGATESDNLAIKGVAEMYREKGNHIITAMYANNEIGVLQPVAEIGKLCHEKGVIFHTDATQAVGKVPVDVIKQNIDLASISGHKMYGPKGVGALYVRRKNPRVQISAIIDGGGHERGMRSGTLNVPGIVGLGKACSIAQEDMPKESCTLAGLRNRLRDSIMSRLDEVYINGSMEQRLPGNLNISFAYVEGESLLMGINDIAVSSGSACTSATLEPSYVLKALATGDELAHSSIRFGLGRFNTEAEVDYVAARVTETVQRLRELSPLYEMAKEGIDLKSVKWAGE